MSGIITRLERCAQGDTETCELSRGEVVGLLALTTAAAKVVAFHAPSIKTDEEVPTKPLLALRKALAQVRGPE